MNIFGKLPFSRKSDRKKEKSVVSLTHEQNIICSQIQLDDIAHEQTIICRSGGRLSANEKEEKFAPNDTARYFHVISCIFRDIFIESSALRAYIPLCGCRGVVRKNNIS